MSPTNFNNRSFSPRDSRLDKKRALESQSKKLEKRLEEQVQTGLLQLAAFSFRTIKSWSGFAGDV
jgi:hypothetical protein